MPVTTNVARGNHTHAKIRAEGTVRQGAIQSADNFGSSRFTEAGTDNWYIQLTDPKFGPCYWKQEPDGGTVEFYTP